MPDVSTTLGYVGQLLTVFNLTPYLGLMFAMFLIAAAVGMFKR